VRVALERSSIPARGRRIPLRPGMDLTAEIVTDRKSILALLLEPLYKLREAASRAGA
jgi:membrane fusion protein